MKITPIAANYKQQNNRQGFGHVTYAKYLAESPLEIKGLQRLLNMPIVKEFMGVDYKNLQFVPTTRTGFTKVKIWVENAATDGGATPKVYKQVILPYASEKDVESIIRHGYEWCKKNPFIPRMEYDEGLVKRTSIIIQRFINWL